MSQKTELELFPLKNPGHNTATENASFLPISPIYHSLAKLKQKALLYELLSKLPDCLPFGLQHWLQLMVPPSVFSWCSLKFVEPSGTPALSSKEAAISLATCPVWAHTLVRSDGRQGEQGRKKLFPICRTPMSSLHRSLEAERSTGTGRNARPRCSTEPWKGKHWGEKVKNWN